MFEYVHKVTELENWLQTQVKYNLFFRLIPWTVKSIKIIWTNRLLDLNHGEVCIDVVI